MGMDILELLKQGFVLGDGGYLEEAKFRGYSSPRVIVEFPEVMRQIHVDFFRAGSQVLQAHTWWTTLKYLKQRGGDRGWDDRMEEINRRAVRLAKEAAGGEALVAGSLCASAYGVHVFDPNDRAACDAAQAEWDEQIAVMVDGGVDLLICEAFHWLDEARLALACCKKTGIPTAVTMSGGNWASLWLKTEGWPGEDGASPAECARVLVDEGADIVGSNCSSEPRTMWPIVLEMREAVDVPVAFQPVGYRRTAAGWRPIRESMIVPGVEMAEYALRAKDHGINYIGACCGAGPEHIRGMAQALGCEREPI